MAKQIIVNTDVEIMKKRVKRGEIVQVLKELEEANGGMITPYDVVDEARSKKSALHHLFDWDDSSAGDKYRLLQARILLRTVTVEYQGERKEAFFNATVRVGDSKVRGYFPLERVLSDEEIHNDVLRQAVMELEFAQRKYESLRELQGVINTKKLRSVKKRLKS